MAIEVAIAMTLPAATLPKKAMPAAARLPATMPVAAKPSLRRSHSPRPVYTTIPAKQLTKHAAKQLPIAPANNSTVKQIVQTVVTRGVRFSELSLKKR